MAYNPYSAVNAIYKLKGQWETANNSGDTTAKNNAATKAQAYYNQLRSNGYADIADELTASNYAQAKAINDKWAKMGKSSAKDYLYTLGKSKGMSQSDVDKLIGYDDLTGEISFGGKNIGVPDSVVDGNYYISDTSVLDNAFNDYVSRSGTVRTNQSAINQENEKLFAKYNQEYEDLKSTNPFKTETAKAILAKYDLAGLQGRDNAVAEDAGSNGGNIDSFAAANALRQQSALINQGQQTVLDAHQQKLDHARALLSDMGVNIDRVFNQEETAKNNDVARKTEQAAVTGYTPAEWSIRNDAFLKNFVDESGKLKKEYYDTNFQELINNAKANGNTELANKYAILRGLKIFGNFSEYGKYLNEGDIAYTTPQRTEAARQFDEQIAASDRALSAERSETAAERKNKLDLADKEAASALAQIAETAKYAKADAAPALTASQALTALKNGEVSQTVIDAYNYHYGTNYTVDNPPKVATQGSGVVTSPGGADDQDRFDSIIYDNTEAKTADLDSYDGLISEIVWTRAKDAGNTSAVVAGYKDYATYKNAYLVYNDPAKRLTAETWAESR